MKFNYQSFTPSFQVEDQVQANLLTYMVPKLVNNTHNSNYITRFVNMLMYPGKNSGKKLKLQLVMSRVFDRLAKKYDPLEVLFRAIVNSRMIYIVRYVKYGSITIMKKVLVSPDRQILLAIHNLAKSARGKSGSIQSRVYNQLIQAYNNTNKSHAIRKKLEMYNLVQQAS